MACAIWTPIATEHLREIAVRIEVDQDRPDVADKIVREIRDKCELYATSPDLGQARPDLGPSQRCFSHKAWVIIYSPIEDGIGVEAIYHAARDYGRVFCSESGREE